MKRLIIMRGLPASGKSTYAKSIMDNETVRLNKDLLRKMLHFDEWSFKNENLTKQAERILAEYFLDIGRNVIIDDTNLGDISRWGEVARLKKASLIEVPIKTSIEDCVKRDMVRPDSVGSDVIINMAMRHKMFIFDKPIVICDLDGTLCNIDHRKHFVKGVEKKDWKSFFEEIPNDSVNEVVKNKLEFLRENNHIIFVSGRPETYKKQTIEWLLNNGFDYALTLIMRRAGDFRPDFEVKQEILDKYFNKDDIKLVIDDRPSVIRMWEENGLPVLNVGDGTEF